MSKIPGFSLTVILAVGLVAGMTDGCAFRVDKDPNAPVGATPDIHQQSTIGYAEVNARIFHTSCTVCHDGGQAHALLTYSQVKADLPGIKEQVLVAMTMPKSGPLPQADRDFLQQWMDQGAPEVATNPAPAPSPSPVACGGPRPVVTWTQVRSQVMVSCVSCHFASNPQALSDFSDAPTVRSSIGSILGLAIGASLMPPPPTGTPDGAPNPNQLTRDQKDTLAHWAVDGMPD